MREYGKVAPTFWTGNTGRILRQMGRDEQLLALFLVTSPASNMIGLYHLPLSSIVHYLNWSLEGASKGLRRASEGGFCLYDEESEQVFIPEMAAHQIGEPLDKTDKRVKGIIREWENCRKSVFYLDFYRRYKDSFHLPKPKPLPRGLQGACKPLRSQEQEQEQEQDQEYCLPDEPAETQVPLDTSTRKRSTPEPRPRNDLFDAIVTITGADPSVNGAHIGRVCKALGKADPPYTAADVLAIPTAITSAGLSFTITVGAVEKYISWVRTPPIRPSASLHEKPKRETMHERFERVRKEVECRNSSPGGNDMDLSSG